MEGLKILIAGAGALGMLAGGYLSLDNHVTLYGREEHMFPIQQRGLEVYHNGKKDIYDKLITISDTNQNELCGSYDLVIVGVKAYDTYEMLDLVTNKIQFSYIASIQNGLKDDLLIQMFGKNKVLGCVMDEAAQVMSPGCVTYTNSGATYFGVFSGEKNSEKQDISNQLVSSLETKLGHVETAKELDTITWYKNMTIVPVFAFQGGLNLNAEEMTDKSILRPIYKELILETLNIAKAEKIPLRKHKMLKEYYLNPGNIDDNLDKSHLSLASLETPPVCSLLQDLRKSKTRTELNYILWPMLKKAKEHNLNAQLIEAAYFNILKVQQTNLVKDWVREFQIDFV